MGRSDFVAEANKIFKEIKIDIVMGIHFLVFMLVYKLTAKLGPNKKWHLGKNIW